MCSPEAQICAVSSEFGSILFGVLVIVWSAQAGGVLGPHRTLGECLGEGLGECLGEMSGECHGQR